MADIGVAESLMFMVGLLVYEFAVLAIHFWRENRDGESE